MRNFFFAALMILVPLFVSAQVMDGKLEFEGEVDILTGVGSKPTSEQGQIAFSLPSLKFAADYEADQNNSVFFQFQMAEARDGATKRSSLQLTRAFYQFLSDDASWIIRYGLVRSAYLEDSERLLDYDVVPEFRAFAYRYNYLPYSDMGVEVRYVFNPYLDISLGFFNGEENNAKEEGTQKDLYAGLNYDDSSFHFALLAIRGAYDEYEKPLNMKERNLVRIAWKTDWLQLGLEGMTSKELSNATVAYKRAENWDGSMIPEVVVEGQGGCGWLLLSPDVNIDFLLRKDVWDPHKQGESDEIASENMAMIIKDKMRSWVLGYSKTTYKENHSTQSPEREFGFLGLRQIF
ncbi:MAG: hypothetical protein JNL11_03690 [Bdellovibrionaceae bacterium]|nr:hypothetical protein [Pseudobdellovibrionaceae bacterium]